MKKEMKIVKSMFGAYRFFITICILTFLGVVSISWLPSSGQTTNHENIAMHVPAAKTMNVEKFEYKTIQDELISEVDNYIYKRTKGKHDKTLAKAIVENALKYDIDIVFMLSQTHIETAYGTAGIGRPSSKRSLFGVMKRSYSTYDEAVSDYCKILIKSYLVKGKTEQDLMKNYVNGNGHRYAGSLDYERKMRNLYNKINKETNLSALQKRYYVEYDKYLTRLDNLQIDNDTV